MSVERSWRVDSIGIVCIAVVLLYLLGVLRVIVGARLVVKKNSKHVMVYVLFT
jgi:hypothetical protein